ncbi:hypothetical protein C2G38_2062088 [Gigaspora rosea]|uniref:Serine-threonine/tyrosine-protein kinase catalytic domain-containing protein n=1 Tax=Gigaspora rosea TaxID=44941 RepID=A0A397W008_9GLOM|nr:hypothetical protein C2G38_2062088 [Gigaspora rosea]
MVEMTTGQKSFNDYKFDIDLAIMVCNGLRPKLAHDTPDCYVELANQCMNSDPEKRPNISEIITKLNEWLNIANENENKIEEELFGSGFDFIENVSSWFDVIKNESGSFDFIDNESRIKNQFLESDKISKNLPMITEKINNIYTSKPYNISEICTKLSKIYGTKTVSDIEIPSDI